MMKAAIAIVVALCGIARADEQVVQAPIVHRQEPTTKWGIEMLYDQDFFSPRGVEPDGRHIGFTWTREPAIDGVVLVLRRVVKEPGKVDGRPTRVVDRNGNILVAAFLYPSDPDHYHPPFDPLEHPLPVGSTVGEWTVITSTDHDPTEPIIDEVEPGVRYIYAFVPAKRGPQPDTYSAFPGDAILSWSVEAHPAWFNRRRWVHLGIIAIIALSLFAFTWLAKRKELFVRRLAGVDAIEDAVGRATEMGRPVLYVTGVEETQDIQTIASLLILGHVAKITAEYDTEIRVANAFPLTMVIAEEIVRQGYANAGRADAHRPDNVMFITSEQFAFAAGVNGMILRERPATNIYFGRFYAESLMLAETGYLTGAVQIAGTGELTQLPFFISACDFTLLGEELFACSAYLTREPNQLALLKAGDVMKVVIALLVVGFTLCATLATQGWYPFTRFSIEDVLP